MPVSSAATASANRFAAVARASWRAEARSRDAGPGLSNGLGRGGSRVGTFLERLQLRPRLRRARKELLVGSGPEPAPRLGEPVELALDVLHAAGIGLEGGEERAQRTRGLAQAQLGVSELVGRLLQLGGEPFDRRERALGLGGEAGRPFAVLRIERLSRGRRAVDELGQMTQALPLFAQCVLVARLHSGRVLDERAELGQAGLRGGGAERQLLMAASRRGQLAPGRARIRTAADLLLAAERIEHRELV